MSAKGTGRQITGWFEERLGLASAREFLAHKTVPVQSATMWYYFGGITLAGGVVGGCAILGVRPGGHGANPAGDRRGSGPAGLPGHILRIGVLAMSKTGKPLVLLPKLLLLLPWLFGTLFAAHVFAADSCLTCHQPMGPKKVVKSFEVHSRTCGY